MSDSYKDDSEERKLREELAAHLGVEFCSEEDLETERQIAEQEPIVSSNGTPSNVIAISVREIIERCNEAGKLMGINNPNKHLMYLCAMALSQMADRLAKYESEVQ